ncbi:ribosomal protein L2 (mitochondrion) [Naegleria fowleri]|uniref:Ribosomal protein L2 n=1 Tax=Naegleria fowleri TaxID=5763 RepID=M4H6Q5_NAEFO|nr:ribosomal protein L2 [Naegleria fowleri]AFP72314.1 ribosomal protein L2 [Naegleria fowleri]AOS85621.1 ribosomal protein L2 [Naegleria fowleri]AOS85667.1 ribosomal protein L2 [Naegleria fowleri]UAT97082.1 ribosomal protein L2 [Naegleria fowleri]WND64452.1 50S ribosomal protein L2 [Naegleria fowleri]
MLYYKAITPSMRHLCLVNKKNLEKSIFLPSLLLKKNSCYGRNKDGRITVFHKECGHKKLYRLVDFFYLKEIPYIVESIEYDPNRSSFINLIFYKNGVYSFIIATSGVILGNTYMCSIKLYDFLKIGNRSFFLNLPIGSIVHNISTLLNSNSKYLRAAGVSGILVKKEKGYAYIKLPCSGGFKLLKSSLYGFGTLGKTSNTSFRSIKFGKAGRSRWYGIRPTVRGVAMNPVDHPHGGGEGKKSKKSSPTNKWASVIKYSRKFKRKKS